ncbi:Hypothetical protein GLP15_2569 [Giardia lamblia P15]|uniref:Uncharacterized protein n=1 Tax=Giardia intestinalis (strain P15) TaxID=658858 RepID=E1EXN8_GIAIA|nr:Hypothetical protein GLP15_2569 [Giardia lamblia P15]
MSEEGGQVTVLGSFLSANEARLPLAYRNKERLGAAMLRRCANEIGGEFDTESAEIARLGPVDDLSVREDEILLDRDVAALMHMDELDLQRLLEGLEQEVDRAFGSDALVHWAATRPEAIFFAQDNGDYRMTTESIRESAGTICMKMYEDIREQNALEKDLVRVLDQNITELQSATLQLNSQQASDVVGNIRHSLMHIKMRLDERRKQSTSRRACRLKKAERKERYLAMAPNDQEARLHELRQRVAHYIAADTGV